MDTNMTKIAAIWSELEETIECQMKHLMIAKWNTHQETTKIEPDTEMMQSAVEH
jgi:hypothetical protein